MKLLVLGALNLLTVYLHAQDTIPLVKSDSTCYYRLSVNAELSASYIDQHNWELQGNSLISISGATDIRERLIRKSGWEHNHSFRTEISYMNYTDSIWLKSSDYARLILQWKKHSDKNVVYSYSALLSTQWLNSWTNRLTETGYRKEWSGGFFNPATLELAYGFNKDLWKNSNLNIAFVSARINTLPRNAELPDSSNEKDQSLFITKHSYIKSSYGFSAQLSVYEELCNNVLLIENDSRIFFNALNKSAINLDFNNRIAIRFLKYLQLRFDLILIYNPDYSEKLQYRQEVLLDVFFQHNYRHAK